MFFKLLACITVSKRTRLKYDERDITKNLLDFNYLKNKINAYSKVNLTLYTNISTLKFSKRGKLYTLHINLIFSSEYYHY